jgi:integral membrane protein (TIGR01906 family)
MPNYNEPEITTLLQYFQGSELNSDYSIEETIHLKDVRNLIWLSWIIIIILTIILFFSSTKDLIYAGIISLIITLILPLIFISFNSSFILFHKLLFTNNYWLLPSTSKLIQMFPETFFIEAAKQLIFNNLILSLFALVLGYKIKNSQE